MDSVLNRTGDDVPESLNHNEVAKAYYGSIREILEPYGGGSDIKSQSAEAGLAIDRIIENRRIVNWGDNADVQNRIRQDIEDYLFELKTRTGIPLTLDDIDKILDECVGIAKARRP